MDRTVVALGGNAIQRKDAAGSIAQQRTTVKQTAEQLSHALEPEGLLVTHGNGPQVGKLLLQAEQDSNHTPLDVLVAETQAQIGYLLQTAFENACNTGFATLLTRVRVDADDPAFDTPTKPIGPFYTEQEAAEKPFQTMRVDESETGFRRVVPSPAPEQILELDAITALLHAGKNVVCCGGGGIPVTGEPIRGVEAVIDKDAASALLATRVGADRLLILTTVDHAYRDFGGAAQEPITEVAATDLEALLEEGEFGAGSMAPKVRACINFIRDGGEEAIITSPSHVYDAVHGETGTRVVA